jgi:hypothetical protein
MREGLSCSLEEIKFRVCCLLGKGHKLVERRFGRPNEPLLRLSKDCPPSHRGRAVSDQPRPGACHIHVKCAVMAICKARVTLVVEPCERRPASTALLQAS